MSFQEEHKKILLREAEQTIRVGVETGKERKIHAAEFPEELRAIRSTFVTLEIDGQLRGCIGKLEASIALVQDVVENAFSAAFRDPRFPPVQKEEVDFLDISISILQPAVSFPVDSEADLLSRLQPNIDGLILQEGWRRSTFLPAVWDSLKDPRSFVQHLKLKAGLSPEYWSPTLKFFRYTTESFSKADLD